MSLRELARPRDTLGEYQISYYTFYEYSQNSLLIIQHIDRHDAGLLIPVLSF